MIGISATYKCPQRPNQMTQKPHILTVFGTRPEAIKMAPVVRALDAAEGFRQTVCVTAQHRQMLDQVLGLFEITPDIDLDLMKHGQTLTGITCRILTAMEQVLADTKPDMVLVHGDTTTTFATSLAAFYQQIPVGHVEAGLRTGDRYHPWPEELNRKLTDAITELYFAPTSGAAANLRAEGVDEDRLVVTGNTVIDALLEVRDRLTSDTSSVEGLFEESPILDTLRTRAGQPVSEREPLVLITGHRRENFGEGFRQIVKAIAELATAYPSASFVYPVHLNPRVQKPVYEALTGIDNVFLIPPLDYAPFVYLMDQATLLLTDSGGIQEEAPSLGKPVLVMRETTERPEAIEAGTARLVGTDTARIKREVARLLDDADAYEEMATAQNPFGDGTAARQIMAALKAYFAKRSNLAV